MIHRGPQGVVQSLSLFANLSSSPKFAQVSLGGSPEPFYAPGTTLWWNNKRKNPDIFF